MSTGTMICEEQNGPQLRKHEEVTLKMSYINEATMTLPVKLDDVKSTPNYGWNPLRWLFKRPKFWDVRYEFTVMPQDAPECPTNALSEGMATESNIESTTQHRVSGDVAWGNPEV